MEQYRTDGQRLPGTEREHPLLDRIHHQFERHPARNSRWSVSWNDVEQRMGKCPAGKRGASESVWRHIGDSVLLFDVPGTEQQIKNLKGCDSTAVVSLQLRQKV